MKNRITLALAVVALLAVLGFTQQKPPRAAWEYMTLEGKSADTILNGFGASGWELVAVETQGKDAVYFFKRAK